MLTGQETPILRPGPRRVWATVAARTFVLCADQISGVQPCASESLSRSLSDRHYTVRGRSRIAVGVSHRPTGARRVTRTSTKRPLRISTKQGTSNASAYANHSWADPRVHLAPCHRPRDRPVATGSAEVRVRHVLRVGLRGVLRHRRVGRRIRRDRCVRRYSSEMVAGRHPDCPDWGNLRQPRGHLCRERVGPVGPHERDEFSRNQWTSDVVQGREDRVCEQPIRIPRALRGQCRRYGPGATDERDWFQRPIRLVTRRKFDGRHAGSGRRLGSVHDARGRVEPGALDRQRRAKRSDLMGTERQSDRVRLHGRGLRHQRRRHRTRWSDDWLW